MSTVNGLFVTNNDRVPRRLIDVLESVIVLFL